MKKLLLMVELLYKPNLLTYLFLICCSLCISLSSFGQTKIEASQTNAMRYEQGLSALNKLDSNGINKVLRSLEEIAPEFGDYILTFAYGDIHTKSSLSTKEKQIATIAALTTKGHALPQLKFHIQAGLNLGLKVEEIKDVILLMSVYAGFPETLNSLMVLKEVVEASK
ncbi:MAG: carboxymuconolactone decarboxylase family protein [Saprospiraceae bacterium]